MRQIPIIRSRRVNKILFFLFLSLTGIALVLTIATTILDESNDSLLVTGLAMMLIFAGFTLFFGILWAIFAHREKKINRRRNESLQNYLSDTYWADADEMLRGLEFTLPKEELMQTARKRLDKAVAGILIGFTGVWLMVYIFVSIVAGLGDDYIERLIATLCVGLATAVPGLAIQGSIYNKFVGSLPEKIKLFFGKLVIDDRVYTSNAIKEVIVSANSSGNPASAKIFRTLTVITDRDRKEYTIDFRAPSLGKWEQPRWEGYETFAQKLVEWGFNNKVTVKVDYMD